MRVRVAEALAIIDAAAERCDSVEGLDMLTRIYQRIYAGRRDFGGLTWTEVQA
jgi:hypothetical protein